VQGRLPTCYSPVRHSSTPEEVSAFDLHVLSTPPAFVLSQDQTLQQRKTQSQPPKKQRQKNKNHSPHRHTVEFSKNTPTPPAPTTGTNSQANLSSCVDHTIRPFFRCFEGVSHPVSRQPNVLPESPVINSPSIEQKLGGRNTLPGALRGVKPRAPVWCASGPLTDIPYAPASAVLARLFASCSVRHSVRRTKSYGHSP
jgi:hypothetical protein